MYTAHHFQTHNNKLLDALKQCSAAPVQEVSCCCNHIISGLLKHIGIDLYMASHTHLLHFSYMYLKGHKYCEDVGNKEKSLMKDEHTNDPCDAHDE